MAETLTRIAAHELIICAARLLEVAGMPRERARIVGEVLVEGDLLGHTTHGLALLPAYLNAIQDGTMATGDDFAIVNDSGANVAWDGMRLPGPWLIRRGIELGMERAQEYGSFILSIRRSHHIACLAAYLAAVTDRGFMIILASSDPSVESVAPFGGTRRMITPNPLAAGIPTGGLPILLDISMSSTTNAMVTRLRDQGQKFQHPWLLDARGNPTTDPNSFFTEPPGSILPLGGADLGYKGFGLGLLIEALTSGLAGHGRADAKEGWGASVFLQILSPSFWGGEASFRRQMDALVTSAHESPPAAGHEKVRLPGERALSMRAEQLNKGVALQTSIEQPIREWALRLGIDMPFPPTRDTAKLC